MEHSSYCWQSYLLSKSTLNKLYYLWCLTWTRLYQPKNRSPRCDGGIAQRQSWCATLLVCSCPWSFPCASAAYQSSRQKPICAAYGISLGKMVWHRSRVQVWFESWLFAKDWVCPRNWWYGIQISRSVFDHMGLPSYTSIHGQQDKWPAGLKAQGWQPSRGDQWLDHLLCQHVQISASFRDISILTEAARFLDRDMFMRYLGSGVGHCSPASVTVYDNDEPMAVD